MLGTFEFIGQHTSFRIDPIRAALIREPGTTIRKVTGDQLSELLDGPKKMSRFSCRVMPTFAGTCNPESNSYVESAPTTDPDEYIRRADKLLARGYVERTAGASSPKAASSSTVQYYRDPKVRVVQRKWNLRDLQHASAICDGQRRNLFGIAPHLFWRNWTGHTCQYSSIVRTHPPHFPVIGSTGKGGSRWRRSISHPMGNGPKLPLRHR